MADYFSDREQGPRPRTEEVISVAAWGGVVGLVRSLISTGAFGSNGWSAIFAKYADTGSGMQPIAEPVAADIR
jgi:hypothetical protein